jgi:hypothetical protein
MAERIQTDVRCGDSLITLEDSFTSLLGRQPSDKERQALLRTRDALNLKNNDALWLVLMALGHYETIYCRFPALIARAAADVTEKARTVAEGEVKAASSRLHAKLAETVAKSALDIADRAASTKRWQWVSTCLIVAASAFLVVGGWSYRTGHRSGYASGRADGYSDAHDERAAAAWANTPEGQLAYGLAAAGSIRELAACSGSGWVRRAGACFATVQNGSVHGWNLPVEASTVQTRSAFREDARSVARWKRH